MLLISTDDFNALRDHGRQTYPHESCGILLGVVEGDQRQVTQVVRCRNTRDDRAQDRYQIDPAELLAAQRTGRAHGLEIVGFYHSHPDHPAQWSSTDLAEAHWLGSSYVITSVDHGQPTHTRAFVLRGELEEDKRFEPDPLEVATTPATSPQEDHQPCPM